MKILIVESEFKSRKHFFDYLATNKTLLMDAKKTSTKFTDTCEVLLAAKNIIDKAAADTGKYLYKNNLEDGTLQRTIVGNTYNWLDSHDDVHLNNLFSTSLKERGSRIPHLQDHEFKLSSKVGRPMKIYEQEVKWRELGVDKAGSTMALMMDSEIRKDYNDRIFNEYLNDQIDQHSVKMQYVKLGLAINDEDYKDEYKLWQAVIDKLGNPQKAEAQGYFWAVQEAKLGEISAVLAGSNELTPTMGKDKILSVSTADKTESSTPLDVNQLLNSYKF